MTDRTSEAIREHVQTATVPTGDIEAVRARARRRRNRRRLIAATAAIVAVGATAGLVLRFVDQPILPAIGSDPANPEPEPSVRTGDSGAFVENATTDPDRMRAEPRVASPGEVVEVAFPHGDDRGPGFVIERRTEDGWLWEWVVHSDPGDDPTPSSGASSSAMSAEEFQRREVQWVSGPLFHQPGRHPITIPEDAIPGRHRICVAPTERPLCAELEVMPAD